MKKIIFLLLVLAMVRVSGIWAQEENHNMIIKMADGTTLLINPNDVDSISFNNGAVSFSGSNIDKLVQMIENNQVRIASLDYKMAAVNDDLSLTKYKLDDTKVRVEEHAKRIEDLRYSQDDIKVDAARLSKEISDLNSPLSSFLNCSKEETGEALVDYLQHLAKEIAILMDQLSK